MLWRLSATTFCSTGILSIAKNGERPESARMGTRATIGTIQSACFGNKASAVVALPVTFRISQSSKESRRHRLNPKRMQLSQLQVEMGRAQARQLLLARRKLRPMKMPMLLSLQRLLVAGVVKRRLPTSNPPLPLSELPLLTASCSQLPRFGQLAKTHVFISLPIIIQWLLVIALPTT